MQPSWLRETGAVSRSGVRHRLFKEEALRSRGRTLGGKEHAFYAIRRGESRINGVFIFYSILN